MVAVRPVSGRLRFRRSASLVRLDASESGLDRESFVLCHDLTTLAVDGIGARLALLNAKRMEGVDAALERALDLV
jgi:mRNA-degrading endonuclease toxin of MazEF toxin-antitoxin module